MPFGVRPFRNRVLATIRKAFRPNHPIFLGKVFRDDSWWQLGTRQSRKEVFSPTHGSSSESSSDADTIGWLDGKPESGARNCALYKFTPVLLPAHIHDPYSSGLELRAHLHAARAWSSLLVHRLRTASSYAPDRICHDYGVQSDRLGAKHNWLASASLEAGPGEH